MQLSVLSGRVGRQDLDNAIIEILLTARGRRTVLRAADKCGIDHVLRACVSGKKYSWSESGDLIRSIRRRYEASSYLLGHAYLHLVSALADGLLRALLHWVIIYLP